MSGKDINPEIVRFKEFINKHPKLIRDIRKNGKSWQEAYEQWILLGEEDIHWEQYRESVDSDEKKDEGEEKKKIDMNMDLVKQILKYTESMDMDKLQDQVQQLSKTVTTVQKVVEQFQQTNKSKTKAPERPFQWFND